MSCMATYGEVRCRRAPTWHVFWTTGTNSLFCDPCFYLFRWQRPFRTVHRASYPCFAVGETFAQGCAPIVGHNPTAHRCEFLQQDASELPIVIQALSVLGEAEATS